MSLKRDEYVLRNLVKVWTEFEANLNSIPFIDKINKGKLRTDDYKIWLLNHRQQVIEGSRWITLAASSITHRYADLRSRFIMHAAAEHKDYKLLEDNYIAMGGSQAEIECYPKNIGAEALSAFMFYQASQPDPFHLLGAMFIIEGLGQRKAGEWGGLIKQQLQLSDAQVSFLLYHGKNDESHMDEFYEILSSGILEMDGLADHIIKTSKVVTKLYQLQLELMHDKTKASRGEPDNER